MDSSRHRLVQNNKPILPGLSISNDRTVEQTTWAPFRSKDNFPVMDFNRKIKMRILCWKDGVLILKRLHPTWLCTWNYILTMRLDDAKHYIDVTMGAMAFQITGISTVCLSVGPGVHKRNVQIPRHWPLWGVSTGNPPGFPSQRASYAEYVSIWWRHHVVCLSVHLSPCHYHCRLCHQWRNEIVQMSLEYYCMRSNWWWLAALTLTLGCRQIMT